MQGVMGLAIFENEGIAAGFFGGKKEALHVAG